MNVREKAAAEIRAQIERFVHKYNALENLPYDFETGKLHPAEVHLLEAVGEGRGLTGRELCLQLGVSKGAVSQIVKKLVRKGLLSAAREARNGKEIPLSLTEKGWKAFRAHERFHRRIDGDMIKGASFSPFQIRSFRKVLAFLEEHLDDYISLKGRWK